MIPFETLPDTPIINDPFPHFYIDNFLDETMALDLADHFPRADHSWYKYDNHFEKKRAMDDQDNLPPEIIATLQYFNSKPIIAWLERVTGIQGLVPDPWMRGGGCHQIERGGKLDVHVDFNIHPHLKLHRRLNLLYYCTPGWESEWGGHLELWSKDMSKCVTRILPEFNRLAVFATSEDSYHGHPEPLMCPKWATRNSLALYYYTAESPHMAKAHSTMFMKRPGEKTTNEIELLRKKRNKGRLN